ncbi:MAG: regulatory iron-sulfur-containing complex subunit RicT [Muribaculaceae bacterium]|nr:regulatory iron-sulfur-containing complex subunit RicT [Bacteroidales bacterium]MDY2734063.1 regulatory iron-sulfur-containing complex subunit RicT [Muribaculaceae bacterium]MDY4649268.1 regulatory iron-sulfur-containing complex subunit RicT [Muribaculaceae bacterium]
MEQDKTKKRYCSERGCPRGNLYATNWLEGISDSNDNEVVEVSFKNTRVGFYRNLSRLTLKIGDIVAVEGNPGHDIGRVSMVGRLVRLQMRKNGVKNEEELKRVYRLATQADMEKFEEARSKEHSTMIRTRKIAEELGLDMKIGDVEYQGDGGKAIFYYIADERVDFRKLIRILADTFKVRVEMKQIGARQEAGRIGGIGPCGRPLCCASWMTHFVSVGTGAARVQDLSMNPQKLAGQCAKLKCCLNFETDVYSEAQHKMPPKDAVLQTMDTDYYFFKQDVLAGIVTYSTDKKIPANLVTISAERAIEVISLNKQGVKVEALDNTKSEEKPQATEYVNLVGQDSLTRFDKSKKKKKKSKPSGDHRQEGEKRPDHQERKRKQRRRPGGGNKNTEPKEG